MSFPTSSRFGNSFLGNNSATKMEVHDLNNEDKNPNGCQIDEILKAGHGVRFTPDTLQQAHNEEYDNCAKCIGGSRR